MDKFDIFTLVLIISYFVLIIFIERIYYQILFDESLEIIPDFQKSGKSLHYFWKFMTFFGTKGGIGPIYVVLFLFIPLNKVYTLTFLLLFTGFVDHTSKMVYRQERPLWMNDEIDIGNNHACGYGNPSGHSLSSSCIYLSLWYVLCDIIDEKISDKLKAKVIKVITLILSILIFLTIMTSRLYLGVHSLNQIIFGCTLGIGIFFLFLPILKVYYTPKTFFQKQYSNKYTHLIITIMFLFRLFNNISIENFIIQTIPITIIVRFSAPAIETKIAQHLYFFSYKKTILIPTREKSMVSIPILVTYRKSGEQRSISNDNTFCINERFLQ